MESVFDGRADCCGCAMCASQCKFGAISMQADREGFLYPQIDKTKCADCGMCRKACPLQSRGYFKESSVPLFFSATHISRDVLMHSTSGGAFTAISDVFLSQGGAVCGADFDDNLRVIHRITDSTEGRDRMRISKYVQSDMSGIYAKIKETLEKRPVLFTGTPCQCAAVRSFFGGEPQNLFICDVICHSVPSPLVWEEYKKILGEEHGGKVTSAIFRSKKYDWNRQNSNKGFLFTTDSDNELHEDSRYYNLFVYKKMISRPSCEKCPFTDIHRASDMTIADCWGLEKYHKELYNKLGVSLIMVNTQKGRKMLDKISESMNISQREQDEITAEQQRLSEPIEFPAEREAFWNKKLSGEPFFAKEKRPLTPLL